MTGPLRAGPRFFGHRSRGNGREDWRAVPRIDILGTGTGWRLRSVLLMGLVIALLVESLVVVSLFRGTSSARSDVEEATRALEALDGQLAYEDTWLASLYEQLAAPDDARPMDQKTIAGRIDWSGPLAALFGTGGQKVRLASVVTNPDGVMEVQGMASSVAAMGDFQERVRAVSAVLELQSLAWEEDGSSLSFTALLRAR